MLQHVRANACPTCEASDVAWLVTSDGKVMASAEVAASRAERRKGLLGRTSVDGAFVLQPCRWVHTVGMKRPIDVAFVAADGRVLKTVLMRCHRLGAPVWAARWVVEAEAGAFARWGLRVGDRLEIRQ